MASRSRSRSLRSAHSPGRDRERYRSRTRSRSRSPTPRTRDSRSPTPRRSYDSRSHSRSRSPPPRRNGRYRSESRDRSRSRPRSWSRPRGRDSRDSRDRSRSPRPGGTKVRRAYPGDVARALGLPTPTQIVVERLSKNIREHHVREIFGRYGPIRDLDVPMNRTLSQNRGTAYILYEHQADAELALASLHEGEIDGSIPDGSQPASRLARCQHGPSRSPRLPRLPPAGGYNNNRRPSPGYSGPRDNAYRGPESYRGADSGGPRGGSRYRSRSYDSYSSRSRSRSVHRGGGRYDDGYRRRDSRSPAQQSYASYDRPGPRLAPAATTVEAARK
ncbi:hypothetical protein ACCO45_002040 [Purpureocillium lilacinum]|uniref:Uncharacterized protein n=1 Tax=Purpureocillium lilacinum TaxID=33203 RepID=A0ACC4EBA9_PURLI